MSKTYNLKKALWYSVENITAILFGLFSVIVVARIFGPENLGKLSLIQAASATTVFMIALGLDHIIIRELARKPDDLRLLSTVFIMQLFGAIVYTISISILLFIVLKTDVKIDMLFILASVLITTYFSRGTVLKQYFQSINNPKAIAHSALISRVIALLYLAGALASNLEYHYVIFFIAIQSVVQFLILSLIFKRSINQKVLISFDHLRAKKLLKEASPLIASSILFPIFMQADIFIISSFMSERDVGIYSAAAKLVAQLVFVGHIITMTFYLALSKKIDEKSDTTEAFTSGLIMILFSIALVLAIFVSLFASDIVSLIYGSKFDGASDVLQILAWKWLFIIPAALYTRLLVLKGLTKYEFIKSLIVAGLSLSLNYLLIPHYGLSGAAYISVFSYFVADFLIYALFKATRPMFTTGFNAVVGLFIHPFKSMNNISLTLGSK